VSNIAALTVPDLPQHDAPLLLQQGVTTGPVDAAGPSADGAMALPMEFSTFPPNTAAVYYTVAPEAATHGIIHQLSGQLSQLIAKVTVLEADIAALRASAQQAHSTVHHAWGSSSSPPAPAPAELHKHIRGAIASLQHILQGAGGSDQPAALQQPSSATRPARHKQPQQQQQHQQTAAPPQPVPSPAPRHGQAASQHAMQPTAMQPAAMQITAPSTSRGQRQKQQQQRQPLPPQQQQQQQEQQAPAKQPWQQVKPRRTQTHKALMNNQQKLHLQVSLPLKDFASATSGFTTDRPSMQDILAVTLGTRMELDRDFRHSLTGATYVNVVSTPADWSPPSGWNPHLRTPSVVPRQGDRITIAFSLQTLAQVESLIMARRQLKGTGIVLGEVLTPAETQEKQALYQQFVDARAAGIKAQFKRARLFVDGKRVLQTRPSSPMPP